MPSALNTNLSQDISSHPPKKMHKDKAKWTDTGEAAIITTLSNRRLLGMLLRVASSPLFGHWWSSQ